MPPGSRPRLDGVAPSDWNFLEENVQKFTDLAANCPQSSRDRYGRGWSGKPVKARLAISGESRLVDPQLGSLAYLDNSPSFSVGRHTGRSQHSMSRTSTPMIDNSWEAPVLLAPRLADEEPPKRRTPGAPGTAVITKTKPQTKRPSLYRVLLLNDDYTPMEFVVHVLERFFNKDHETAQRIMMHVHQHGIGECGVFTYEVAETKVTQVMDFSRKHQHPLQCVMEKK
jgi:ATP-dependent Clp protease adaptor protein ClpS